LVEANALTKNHYARQPASMEWNSGTTCICTVSNWTVVGGKLFVFVTGHCCTLEYSLNLYFSKFYQSGYTHGQCWWPHGQLC